MAMHCPPQRMAHDTLIAPYFKRGRQCFDASDLTRFQRSNIFCQFSLLPCQVLGFPGVFLGKMPRPPFAQKDGIQTTQAMAGCPLLWLPECSSLRGDPCSVASVVSVLLRLAVLIFWFCAVSFPVESLRRSICFHFDDPGYYSGAECQNLPAWLRTPWWSDNATCVARASRYERCFDEVPWHLAGKKMCFNLSSFQAL